MGLKSAGVGQFHIPTAPAALTAVTQSASANTYGSAAAFGNAPSALFVMAVNVGVASTQVPTYIAVQILVGGSVVGEILVGWGCGTGAASQVISARSDVWPPIPIANGAAITVKAASSVASAVAWGVSLECIAQSNVVDDGIAVATVTSVTNQLTAAQIATGVWQDATAGDFSTASSIGKSLYTTGAAPGAAGGLFIAGTNAATTITTGLTTTFTGNLTGSVASVAGAVGSVTGAVGSVTAAVTLPSIPANWITAAGITASALNGKGDWLLSSGYTVPPTTAAIADKILGRNLAGGSDGTRTVADAMRALRNKTSLAAGVLTVYQEDDTTSAWTAAVVQAARDPISSIDPT